MNTPPAPVTSTPGGSEPDSPALVASAPNPAALVTPAPWSTLKRFTDARIALGRAGHSLPTAAHLDFQLAHAQARDAVHLPFDAAGLAAELERAGLPTLHLHSAAADRNTYLQRPDLGRRLSAPSLQALAHHRAQAQPAVPYDLAVVVADGPALTAFVARCLNEPAWAESLGHRAAALVASQRGATAATARLVLETLGENKVARP